MLLLLSHGQATVEKGFSIYKKVEVENMEEISYVSQRLICDYFNSTEMNIIEDIREALLHVVEKRSPPPRTPMDLLTALQDSWCEFPPGYLQTPVESMPHRFASLLRARGGPTRY
ncbi:hypothetical protein AVEN_148842-1 [Araneus ventricosus]|uniref:Uncharacterized protein n=1 Tax=Araneus ventricosus TaxID=182803 RepID=A0A4Y2U5M3_ARAVE|nr:hypothetical protein AVEN_148842-1 [Araneus ventricosus]